MIIHTKQTGGMGEACMKMTVPRMASGTGGGCGGGGGRLPAISRAWRASCASLA